ncbi:aminoacetone oxidase family FAD-binding enzyme [candidate division KSB1 bacterium]|nr:aminoacetone oxidase family FAD-binding enzyme [candidate division KSB1 bacterium]
MHTIAIIGAGPAGMMAALQAARHKNRIILFESHKQVGKKLLNTGSGRCNITNQFIAAERYTCDDVETLARTLSAFGHAELVEFLRQIAIPIFSTADGWCYPLSQSAAAVVDTFYAALSSAGVELHLGCKIVDIRKAGDRFDLYSENERYQANRVIVAAGGMAYPQLGSRGDCYPILHRMGHTIVPSHPALAPVVANVKALHKLQGVRVDANVQLFRNAQLLAQTTGNVLITQWGLNGPGVMDLSHHIKTEANLGYYFLVNFIPQGEGLLRDMMMEYRKKRWPLRTLLHGILPYKMPPVFMRLASLPVQVTMAEVTEDQLSVLFEFLTSFRIPITGTRDFRFAQTSTGGVPFSEIDAETMQSKKVAGLYLAGETLDVVGPCGGFNLQFAFTTGALAGMAAGEI